MNTSFQKKLTNLDEVKKLVLSLNLFIYGLRSLVPNAQLNPTLRSGKCDIEIKKAFTVCPDKVLPLLSVIVPLNITGIETLFSSK